MPVYVWKHKESGELKEVVRSFDDIEIPPEGCDPEEWERVMGTGIRAKYAPGTSPGGKNFKSRYND